MRVYIYFFIYMYVHELIYIYIYIYIIYLCICAGLVQRCFQAMRHAQPCAGQGICGLILLFLFVGNLWRLYICQYWPFIEGLCNPHRFHTVGLTNQRNIHILCSFCLTQTPWLAYRVRDLRVGGDFSIYLC